MIFSKRSEIIRKILLSDIPFDKKQELLLTVQNSETITLTFCKDCRYFRTSGHVSECTRCGSGSHYFVMPSDYCSLSVPKNLSQ